MLYVSIWRITLSNLEATTFTRRLLPADEAGNLIAQARAEGTFMGVSMSDLGAPYEKRKYQDHVDVCEALRARGVELGVEDFFNDSFCNPLQFARVGQGHRLLVVDCSFLVTLPSEQPAGQKTDGPAETSGRVRERISRLFKVDPESLAFHLFEEKTP